MIAVNLSSVVRSCVRQQLPVELFTADVINVVVDSDDSTGGLVFSISSP